MSTGRPIPLAQARKIADTFRAHFVGMADRWVVAGSVRREKAEVTDIEHVVCARIGEVVPLGGMFPVRANMVWAHLDELVNIHGEFRKAVYQDDTNRWGEKYRGVMFGGMKHEVFCGDKDNFGSLLAIRTGPRELSRELVTALKGRGLYVADAGYVRDAEVVDHEARESAAEGLATKRVTFGPDGRPTGIRPCPTEEAFFDLCGLPFVPPEKRRPLFVGGAR
jgi:DNA polymerase/3'-5' exonuclease PolX